MECEANIAVIQRAFEAFERNDMESLLALCDEQIAITQPPELLDAAPRQHGHAGVLEAFSIWPEQWEDFRIEIVRIVAGPGGEVLVSTRQRGRGRQSGVEVDAEFLFVFTIRDGKIARWQIFLDEEAAQRAAGLGAR